jgi:hypothetical protein
MSEPHERLAISLIPYRKQPSNFFNMAQIERNKKIEGFKKILYCIYAIIGGLYIVYIVGLIL